MGKIEKYYPSSDNTFGYTFKNIVIIFAVDRSYVGNQYHKDWVETITYQPSVIQQINKLLKGTEYEELWNRQKGFVSRKKGLTIEPFVFR
jgi:hypothetical protein